MGDSLPTMEGVPNTVGWLGMQPSSDGTHGPPGGPEPGAEQARVGHFGESDSIRFQPP